MKKRSISLLLVLALVVGICPAAFAAEETTVPEAEVTSFVDSEGKVNTVYLSSSQSGTSHVEYYIDGALTDVVDTVLSDPDAVRRDEFENVMVSMARTDVRNATTTQTTEPLTNYITISQVEAVEPREIMPRVSVYQGKINYNTCYDTDGSVYNDSLYIYQEEGKTTYEYKTIHAEAGWGAAVVVGVISATLAVICPALKIVSESLLYAAAYATGTTIVGGVIQGAITKEYYVQTTPLTIKARDIKTSRENTYAGERYQVALEGGGFSSEYHYEGYAPWNSNDVAYLMFGDFWAYPYPGVKSYSK